MGFRLCEVFTRKWSHGTIFGELWRTLCHISHLSFWVEVLKYRVIRSSLPSSLRSRSRESRTNNGGSQTSPICLHGSRRTYTAMRYPFLHWRMCHCTNENVEFIHTQPSESTDSGWWASSAVVAQFPCRRRCLAQCLLFEYVCLGLFSYRLLIAF